MSIYINGATVAGIGTTVDGIEQVAVLPAIGETTHLYYLTVGTDTYPEGLYW